LSSTTKAQLLARKVAGDFTDPFAADANDSVRELGRLALRRDVQNPSDYFALGDLCARLALQSERLMILYVGKAIQAYRRAGQIARRIGLDTATAGLVRDVALAETMVGDCVRWVVSVAQAAPTARNIAVGLWALTELTPEQQTEADREAGIDLAKRYITTMVTGLNADPTSRQTIEMPLPTLETTQPPSTPTQAESLTVVAPPPILPLPITASVQPARPPAPEWLTETGDNPPLVASVADEVETQDVTDTPSDSFPRRKITPASSSPKPESYGDFAVGDVIRNREGDRYEVQRVLRGGMGVIYVCYDTHEDRRVAIKTFQSKYLNNEHARERFRQEARVWMDLEKHPNIVQARKVETFGQQGVRERPHIILEYISGPEGLGSDLKSWIDQKRLTVQTALEFGIDICSGMIHAVQRVSGLVHRDLKPGNILVRHDGVAKVTDFGLVRSLDSTMDTQEMTMFTPDLLASTASPRLTQTGTRLGTLAYMSPEQCAASRNIDHRADIYAFGVILYEMLCERRPFNSSTPEEWFKAHLRAVPVFPPEREAAIPLELRELTLRCLAKRPEDRPESWEAVREELNACYERLTGGKREIDSSNTALEIDELMDKAYSLTELGRPQEALAVYDRVIDLNPEPRRLGWALARKGRVLRILRQDRESLRYYDEALQLRPEFGWAWYSRAIAHERLKDYDQALQDYARAALYSPRDVWPVYNHAWLLLELGRAEEALAKIDEALRINPTHPHSLTQRAWDLAELGRYEEALCVFDQAIEADPKFGPAWTGKGRVLLRLEQVTEAEKTLIAATRLAPRDDVAWMALSDVYIKQSRYSEALTAAQQAALIRPALKGTQQRVGELLLRLRRYAEALAVFNRVLEGFPRHAPALSGRGMALLNLNQPEQAVISFQQALALSPDRAPYLHALADALFKLRRYEDARAVLETLSLKRPDNKLILARLGKALLRTGEAARALKTYDSLLKIDADSAWALAGRGAALRALGNLEEAAEYYRRAAEADPAHTFRWYDYALILDDLHRYPEALAALAKMSAATAESLTLKGKVLRQLKHYPEALTAYEAAAALKPDLVWAWNGRGLVLQRLKRYDEALISYEKAIDVAPRSVWPRLNLVELLGIVRRHEDALSAVDEAIASCAPIGVPASLLWVQKGHALRALHRHEEAIFAYEQAIHFAPHVAGAWNGKGLACAALGRRAEAITCLKEATNLNKKSAWFWYNLGEVLVEDGAYSEAISALNNAISLKEGFARASRKRDEARHKILKE
jgi:tetratricopeptide (TPR) repeat protein/tRNA A-37 threonylcarbamoyl transferase component Bud32